MDGGDAPCGEIFQEGCHVTRCRPDPVRLGLLRGWPTAVLPWLFPAGGPGGAAPPNWPKCWEQFGFLKWCTGGWNKALTAGEKPRSPKHLATHASGVTALLKHFGGLRAEVQRAECIARDNRLFTTGFLVWSNYKPARLFTSRDLVHSFHGWFSAPETSSSSFRSL